MLNQQKQENENITDQFTDLEKSNEVLELELSRMSNVKSQIAKYLDKVVNKMDTDYNPNNIRQDLTSILHFLLENSEDKASLQKQNNFNVTDDDDRDKINNNKTKASAGNNSNRSSYVTQNYEKFKQTQEAIKKNNENKLINQGN